jgi:hypothetical protein
MAANKKPIIPTTGDVYKLQNGRLCIIANSVLLGELTLYSMMPISTAIYMASDKDFIVVEEEVFKNQSVMAEDWNSIAVPIEFFKKARYIGRLSDKYVRYLSSYIYFALQHKKNDHLRILTGPPITASSDIRWLFRQMEIKEFHQLRQILVSVSE